MPHYYFHLRRGVQLAEDLEGAAFADLQAARMEAIGIARELMRESILDGDLPLEHNVEIADEVGQVLLTVPFREAVRETCP